MTYQAVQGRRVFSGPDEDATVREILEGTAAITGRGFFTALVKTLSEVLGTYSAWVTEYIAASRQLRALAFWVGGGQVDNFLLDIAGTPCEAVIDDARLVHYPDGMADRFPANSIVRDFAAVSYMGVPLLDPGGRVLGNLAVLDNRPMPKESHSELLFRLFAARASAELQRIQAEADIRKREEKYRRIVETAGEGFVLTDSDWTITDVNEAFCRMVGLPRGEVLGKTPLDFASRRQRRFLLDNRGEIYAGRYPEFETELVVKNGGTLPVLVHGNVLQDDAGRGMGYMAFVTNMVEHKKSLVLAGEVQKNLQPQSDIRIDGLDVAGRTVACDEIGGDYYDYIWEQGCSDTRFEAVVGDVAGHGVDAALVMMTARGFLRMRASQCGRISQIVDEMNRHLSSDFFRTGRFMTLFYLSVDRGTGTLRWVRAGHDPGLLYDPLADRFEALDGGGMALGVDAGYAYEEQVKTGLRNGQIIAVGTDGIWETRDSAGRMFGRNRFRDVLRQHAGRSAQEIVDAVHVELSRFSQGIKPSDDTTLVVIKLTDGPQADFQI